jgi:hypothetical protein
MSEGFQKFFERYGEWPWQTARAFRQRELIALGMRGEV